MYGLGYGYKGVGRRAAGNALRYIGIIAAGQSNEVSFDGNASINPALDLTDERIFQYTHDGGMVTVGGFPTPRPADARRLLPATHPLRWPANHQVANWEILWGPSPALHFAYNLLPTLGPNDRLVILPMAVGGVSLINGPWRTDGGGQLYNATISTATQFLADVPGSVLGYILWTQGENHAVNSATVTQAQYEGAFDPMIAGIRGIGPRAADATVIVHSMVPEWSADSSAAGNSAAIEAAHRMTPARLSRSWFVQGASNAFRPGDRIHYNAAGSRASGRRRALAARFPALLTNGATLTAPTNLRPLGANRIAWDIPASGACLYEIRHRPQGGSWTTVTFSPRVFTVPGETLKYDIPGASGMMEVEVSNWYGSTKVPSAILTFDASTAPEPWTLIDYDDAVVSNGLITSVPNKGTNGTAFVAAPGAEFTPVLVGGKRVANGTPTKRMTGPAIPNGPYTILIAVRHRVVTGSGSYFSGSNTFNPYMMWRNATARLHLCFAGIADIAPDPTNMVPNAWYILGMVYDPTAPAAERLKSYRNGVFVAANGAAKAVGTSFTPPSGSAIGGLGAASGAHDGDYGNMGVWLAALNAAQMAQETEKLRQALAVSLAA